MKKEMKKILLLLAAVTAAIKADAVLQMVFEAGNGAKTVMEAEGLRMNIADGKLIAVNESETCQFALSDLAKMYFAEGESDISELFASDAEVEIYDLKGVRYEKLPADFQGTFILKSGDKTFKIYRK